MREVLWVCMAVAFLGSLVNFYVGRRGLVDFLDSVQEIRTPADMRAFKQMAARNMYAALLQLGLMLLYLISLATGWISEVFISWDFLAILGLTVIITLGTKLKKLELGARSLPVEPEWAVEYQEVTDIWLHKPFPTWKNE